MATRDTGKSWLTGMLWVLLAQAACAHASVALLMEEPYGDFGAANPTGHAAVYFNHICAASPTELRVCRSGEWGVVISRYHKIDGYDWIAVPLISYLYAVDDATQVPASVDRAQVAALRDKYRREHLLTLAPDDRKANAPKGEWTELVGSSYDRTIHGFQVVSSAEQDERFIAIYNDKRNVGHFNLLFHNCADFSRVVLDTFLPHAVHRNFIADVGLMTPKQVARSLVRYGKEHPEVGMDAFVIPQVPGSVPRSHPVDGVAESLVKSKKYLLPLAVLAPEFTGGVVVAYLAEGRLKLPRDALVFNVDDAEMQPGQTRREQPAESSDGAPGAPPSPAPAASPDPSSGTPAEPARAAPAERSPTLF